MFADLIITSLDAGFGPEWHSEHTIVGKAIDTAITPTIEALQAQIAALDARVSALEAAIPGLEAEIAAASAK